MNESRVPPGSRLELADIVKLLVGLFPEQHPKSAAWFRGLRSESHRGDVARPSPPPQSVPRRQLKGVRERQPVPPKASLPTPSPTFAKELRMTIALWGDRYNGLEIAWEKEAELQDRVTSAAALANPQNGYLEKMLSVIGDVTVAPGKLASVEIVIPRMEDAKHVLVGIGLKGMPKRFFEVGLSMLSPNNVIELARYVVASRGRQ